MDTKILTPDRERQRLCMQEIDQVLKKYGKVLSPKLTMTTGGISFVVEIVDAAPPKGLIVPKGGSDG